jgi:GNAT superfamily N-acetyltransferase
MTVKPNSILIERWSPVAASINTDLNGLGELLHACVHAGGSVSFVLPFSRQDATAFWRDDVLPGVNAGTRCVLLARQAGEIVGTVQLDMATPPNQPHRAEVRKLLVHPKARRRGMARELMTALEGHARAAGRTLLTLDTVTRGNAEPLYLSMGYVAIGSLPGYALNFDSSRLEATTIMYKQLPAKAS